MELRAAREISRNGIGLAVLSVLAMFLLAVINWGQSGNLLPTWLILLIMIPLLGVALIGALRWRTGREIGAAVEAREKGGHE